MTEEDVVAYDGIHVRYLERRRELYAKKAMRAIALSNNHHVLVIEKTCTFHNVLQVPFISPAALASTCFLALGLVISPRHFYSAPLANQVRTSPSHSEVKRI